MTTPGPDAAASPPERPRVMKILMGKPLTIQRAARIIEIAAPEQRESLRKAAVDAGF